MMKYQKIGFANNPVRKSKFMERRICCRAKMTEYLDLKLSFIQKKYQINRIRSVIKQFLSSDFCLFGT